MIKLKAEEVKEKFDDLIAIINDWNLQPENVGQRKVDDFLNGLKNHGWRRKDVYNLLQLTCDLKLSSLPPDGINYIIDVETAIVGNVASACIMRFPEDPFDDLENLEKYVRTGDWKND